MQIAVVIVIVLLAGILVLRHLVRKVSGRQEAGCGCSSCALADSCGGGGGSNPPAGKCPGSTNDPGPGSTDGPS
jgi:hypothetical protein